MKSSATNAIHDPTTSQAAINITDTIDAVPYQRTTDLLGCTLGPINPATPSKLTFGGKPAYASRLVIPRPPLAPRLC
jgi:hypothetical protein